MTLPRADRPTAPLGHRTDVVGGRFALDQPIASGGSGTVWTADDLKLGQRCAAKVLRRRDGGDLLRFAREQAVRLRHPHVLTPYSWAAEDEHVVIASELVAGGSLATLSGDWGPLSEPTVVEVLRQLLVALEHVHSLGLVHRDVKPANVLLHATGEGPLDALLTDFGLALRPDDARLTEHGTVIGTPGYLAPELYRPGTTPGPRQDLYALGELGVALLTAFQPGGIERPVWLAEIRDPALAATLAALTEPRPEDRPADAASAMRLLQGAHGDPRPRTADGDPVEVVDQLTHLGDSAPATTPAALLAPAPHPTRTDASTPPPAPPASFSSPGSSGSSGSSAAPAATDPDRTGGRRRPWAIGVAAAVLAAAVTTAVVAAVTAGSGSGSPDGGTSGSTSDTTGQVVELGSSCTWQQEGDEARTGTATSATCTGTDAGYVWTKTG